MKGLLIAIFFTCIASLVQSQTIELEEQVSHTYSSSTGAPSANPFHRFKFRLSHEYEYRRVGHTGRHIRPYFENSPEALKELNKFRTKRIIATTAGLSAVAYAITYFAIESSKPEKPLSSNPAEDTGPDFTPLIVPVATLTLIDVICAATSNSNLRKSVEFYNKKQLSSKAMGLKPKLVIGSSSRGLGLRIALKF